MSGAEQSAVRGEAPAAEAALPPADRRRNGLLTGLGLALAMLMVGGAGLAAYYGEVLDHSVRGIKHDPQVVPLAEANTSRLVTPASAPMDILLLLTQPAGTGTALTDSVQVLHLSEDRKSSHLLSFPAALTVEVPDRGPGTLQQAFSWGGSPLVARAIESLLGGRLTHAVVLGLTDALGMADVLGGLGGSTNPSFVGPDGDHRLVQALLTRAIASETLIFDPGQFAAMVALVGRCITIDSALTVPEAFRIAIDLRTNAPVVRSLKAPVSGSQSPAKNLKSDAAQMRELAAAVRSDSLDSYAATHP